jgi:hypothetical protein
MDRPPTSLSRRIRDIPAHRRSLPSRRPSQNSCVYLEDWTAPSRVGPRISVVTGSSMPSLREGAPPTGCWVHHDCEEPAARADLQPRDKRDCDRLWRRPPLLGRWEVLLKRGRQFAVHVRRHSSTHSDDASYASVIARSETTPHHGEEYSLLRSNNRQFGLKRSGSVMAAAVLTACLL